MAEKIVFVLGAGASVPYGYPTGAGLKTLIVSSLGRPDVRAYLIGAGYREDLINQFEASFVKSGVFSIDAFLEHNPKFISLGKLLIARSLLLFENPDILKREIKDDWIRLIHNIVNYSSASMFEHDISFITFNYDRSLEFVLHESIKNKFGDINDEGIKKIMSAFPVYHVHGKLGSLPHEVDDLPKRDYAIVTNLETVEGISKNIKVLHEDGYDSEEYNTVKSVIASAQKVVYLGFGFHQENLKKIGIEANQTTCQIYNIFDTPVGDLPRQMAKKVGKASLASNVASGNARVDDTSNVGWTHGDNSSVFKHFTSKIF